MKLDDIKNHLKNKKELVPTMLLAISVLCGILILVKVTSFFVAKARAESIVKRAIRQNETDSKNIEKYLAGSATITNDLKRNNLFAPPLPPQHPVKEVSGIFGDQVYIKDKWYNVGDMVDDAKIVAIGPTSVTIMWDGKEKSFLPIQSKIEEASSGSRSRTSTVKSPQSSGNNENGKKVPTKVTVNVEGAGPGFGGRGGPGAGFMEMRQRFENMSERERQEFRERMRERFAGGRGGPGGGRGPGGRR